MNRQFLKDSLFWGFIIWLLGYALGMMLFFLVPPAILGWVIMPIGIMVTLLVLFKKVKSTSRKYYLGLGLAWVILAIILDYFLLVRLLHPVDGYYKLDVYLYYIITFILPLLVGFKKNIKK